MLYNSSSVKSWQAPQELQLRDQWLSACHGSVTGSYSCCDSGKGRPCASNQIVGGRSVTTGGGELKAEEPVCGEMNGVGCCVGREYCAGHG